MQLSLKESERGAVSLLSRWPDAWRCLRGCLNISLPKDLRMCAWRSCLKDDSACSDFLVYMSSDRIDFMTGAFSPSLYDLCQAYLASNPNIIPLATQYRCVKRMEQVLMYLFERSSCPKLHNANLHFLKLPRPAELSRADGARILLDEFGGAAGLKLDFLHTTDEADDAGERDGVALAAEGSDLPMETMGSGEVALGLGMRPPNDDGNDTSAAPLLRIRQLAIMVPFLKALEMDAGGYHAPASGSTDSTELPGMVSPAAEPTAAGAWRAVGGGGVRRRAQQGNAIGDVNGRPGEAGYWMDGQREQREEVKTGRIVEAVAAFWAMMPAHWRNNGCYLVETYASEVESYLHQEDFQLFSHVTKVIGEASAGNDFKGYNPLVRHILGDMFVGKCNLDVLAYIFDQLIIGSFESTQDPDFPPFDTLISWFCTGFLFAMRDRILKSTMEKHMFEIIRVAQPLVTVQTLSSLIELRFISRFRRALTNPADLGSQLFGVARPTTSEMAAATKAVARYRSKFRNGAADDPDGDGEGEAETLVELSEIDLIECEMGETEEEAVVRWLAARRRKAERKAALAKLWKQYGRAIGKWIRFINITKEAVIARAEEAKRLEELLRLQMLQRVRTPTPELIPEPELPPPPPPPEVRVVKAEPPERDHRRNLDMVEEDEEAEPEIVLEHVDTGPKPNTYHPKMRDGSVLVQPETFVLLFILVTELQLISVQSSVKGEEIEHLTPLGRVIMAIYRTTRYVIEGPVDINPSTRRQVAHAINFERQLLRDLDKALKGNQKPSRSGSLKSPTSASRSSTLKSASTSKFPSKSSLKSPSKSNFPNKSGSVAPSESTLASSSTISSQPPGARKKRPAPLKINTKLTPRTPSAMTSQTLSPISATSTTLSATSTVVSPFPTSALSSTTLAPPAFASSTLSSRPTINHAASSRSPGPPTRLNKAQSTRSSKPFLASRITLSAHDEEGDEEEDNEDEDSAFASRFSMKRSGTVNGRSMSVKRGSITPSPIVERPMVEEEAEAGEEAPVVDRAVVMKALETMAKGKRDKLLDAVEKTRKHRRDDMFAEKDELGLQIADEGEDHDIGLSAAKTALTSKEDRAHTRSLTGLVGLLHARTHCVIHGDSTACETNRAASHYAEHFFLEDEKEAWRVVFPHEPYSPEAVARLVHGFETDVTASDATLSLSPTSALSPLSPLTPLSPASNARRASRLALEKAELDQQALSKQSRHLRGRQSVAGSMNVASSPVGGASPSGAGGLQADGRVGRSRSLASARARSQSRTQVDQSRASNLTMNGGSGDGALSDPGAQSSSRSRFPSSAAVGTEGGGGGGAGGKSVSRSRMLFRSSNRLSRSVDKLAKIEKRNRENFFKQMDRLRKMRYGKDHVLEFTSKV
ncbi:hypothetical protein HK101_001299 [Irineochytrium annulatum]|nr:hypothetical protein HK101_001299 [Irineochytrium annulatum]